MTDAPPVPRDAASLILVRRDGPAPRVLMGQRGAGARFMPSKFVFPGGAFDPADADVPRPGALPAACARRLDTASPPGLGRTLALSALRETFEEAGLAIGAPDPGAPALAAAAPAGWRGFFGRGVVPRLDRLRFVFRAITPPTRPVRFDARFFMAEARDVAGDTDDFSAAEDELSHLQWLTLAEARRLDLPFITAVVLAEVEARIARDPWPEARPVPFFRHDAAGSYVDALA
jgi:8-oxo-dGTP pyrophosphatase MutT (NUDIX family)